MTSEEEEFEPGWVLAGTRIGRWCVVERCGRGSSGAVYRARSVDPAETGEVALKLAHTPRDERFEREEELLRRIRHGNVPELRGEGRWEDPRGVSFPYLAMEWIEGVSLYEWVRQSQPSSRQMMRALAGVARALEATHRHGVHRDVKGANVLVSAEGKGFLIDFGAGAKQGALRVKRARVALGAPMYRSPRERRFVGGLDEEGEGRYEATGADDVYALGVAAYRAVTGEYPPETDLGRGNEPSQSPLLEQEEPRARAAASGELNRLILRMLKEAPEERGSAGEVARALEEAAATEGATADAPIERRVRSVGAMRREGLAQRMRRGMARGWPWLAGAVAGAGLMGLLWWSMNSAEPEVREAVLAREGEREEGGTAAMGDKAPGMPRATASLPERTRGVWLEMPKRPFPGQRLAPCDRDFEREVELTEGQKDTRSCWIEIKVAAGKCKAKGYEHRGGCFLPSYPPPKLPQTLLP